MITINYEILTNIFSLNKRRFSLLSIPKELNMKNHFNETHGMKKHELYNTWSGMIHRCSSPKNRYYKDYGGKGVTVCERWLDIRNFIEDMTPRPKGMTMERVDNNGDYNLVNCCWATASQQARNRKSNHRITIGKRTQLLIEWCEELDLNYPKIIARLNVLKWPPEEALEIKPRKK